MGWGAREGENQWRDSRVREKTYADAGYSRDQAQSLYDAQAEHHRQGGTYDYSTGEWKDRYGAVVGVPGMGGGN